ncbi:Serine protease [Globodera pallida]|nr:Serine protease [Globodera pallida]
MPMTKKNGHGVVSFSFSSPSPASSSSSSSSSSLPILCLVDWTARKCREQLVQLPAPRFAANVPLVSLSEEHQYSIGDSSPEDDDGGGGYRNQLELLHARVAETVEERQQPNHHNTFKQYIIHNNNKNNSSTPTPWHNIFKAYKSANNNNRSNNNNSSTETNRNISGTVGITSEQYKYKLNNIKNSSASLAFSCNSGCCCHGIICCTAARWVAITNQDMAGWTTRWARREGAEVAEAEAKSSANNANNNNNCKQYNHCHHHNTTNKFEQYNNHRINNNNSTNAGAPKRWPKAFRASISPLWVSAPQLTRRPPTVPTPSARFSVAPNDPTLYAVRPTTPMNGLSLASSTPTSISMDTASNQLGDDKKLLIGVGSLSIVVMVGAILLCVFCKRCNSLCSQLANAAGAAGGGGAQVAAGAGVKAGYTPIPPNEFASPQLQHHAMANFERNGHPGTMPSSVTLRNGGGGGTGALGNGMATSAAAVVGMEQQQRQTRVVLANGSNGGGAGGGRTQRETAPLINAAAAAAVPSSTTATRSAGAGGYYQQHTRAGDEARKRDFKECSTTTTASTTTTTTRRTPMPAETVAKGVPGLYFTFDYIIADTKYEPQSSGDHQLPGGKASKSVPLTVQGSDSGQGHDNGCGLAATSRGAIEYGQESPSGDWSWTASVSIECENKSTNAVTILQTCTGVLIGHKHLLTAAHGLYTDFKNVINCKGTDLTLRDIKGYIVHKDYIFNGLKNDMAMIELANPVKFGPSVNRICLPSLYAPVDGHVGYVLCYGHTSGSSTVLKETTALLREDLIQFRVSAPCPAQLICSRHQTRQTEPGDSGGPLMREFDGSPELVVSRESQLCAAGCLM